MAKVIGIHIMELKSGVSEADFEKFITEEYLPEVSALSGMQTTYYKGDRGERAGKYLLVFELESAERRDQLYPVTDQASAEMQQWIAANQALWDKLFSLSESISFTDYVELG